MATLASLVVSLEANVARFESDLNKAEFMAKKAMDTIGNVSETAMKAVKGAVMAMAAAYTLTPLPTASRGRLRLRVNSTRWLRRPVPRWKPSLA